MSRSPNRLRRKQITINYSEEEYAELQKQFVRSANLHLSAYIRKVSMAEPVEVKIRNASFDEFLAIIIPLQRDLRTLRRLHEFTPENETQLVELHRAIQHALEKITLPCMPS